jgi:hypothetical protein
VVFESGFTGLSKKIGSSLILSAQQLVVFVSGFTGFLGLTTTSLV